jgi:hypothetical protein
MEYIGAPLLPPLRPLLYVGHGWTAPPFKGTMLARGAPRVEPDAEAERKKSLIWRRTKKP